MLAEINKKIQVEMNMTHCNSQRQQNSNKTTPFNQQNANNKFPSTKNNQVGAVILYGVPIVSLVIDAQERLCLAQISNTLLKAFSYNEIHNRRVALGITCVQCTPVQLEILRRAGAMPVSSRRCGMITRREAERLCKSFLGDNSPPRLPDDFAFNVHHECAWGCNGSFLPSRYNSSRAKCIKCCVCGLFFSPNKFIFHSHRTCPTDKYIQPDAANFNSWRRHMKLSGHPPEQVIHAWEDVKAMFNGGTRKRMLSNQTSCSTSAPNKKSTNNILKGSKSNQSSQSVECDQKYPLPMISSSAGSLPFVMDYVWQQGTLKSSHLSAYQNFPWFTHSGKFGFGLPNAGSPFFFPKHHTEDGHLYQSAFRPVYPTTVHHYKQSEEVILKENSNDNDNNNNNNNNNENNGDDEDVDIETCNEEVESQ